MQSKEEVYRNQVMPLIDQIIAICVDNDIAMLTSFCLEHFEAQGDKYEMLLTGAAHLDNTTNPPLPMLYAAALLNVPGFVAEEIAQANMPKLASMVH